MLTIATSRNAPSAQAQESNMTTFGILFLISTVAATLFFTPAR
jgi:hypothetical protein